MAIDKALILKLEKLSKLKLSEEERNELQPELEKMIEMINQIAEVDTEEVEPLRHMVDVENVLRPDVEKPSLSAGVVEQIAPKHHGQFFAVPKVINK